MTTRSACCSTLRWAIAATLASGCAQIHKLAGQIDKAAGTVADAAARPDLVTGQRQFNIMSEEEEARTGAEQASVQLDEYRQAGVQVDVDQPTRLRLLHIAERLVRVSHRPETEVTLHLVETPVANAFAVGGGHVFVLRGLFTLARSEDEVAVVLGHEWGHVTARHMAEQKSRAMVDRRLEKDAIYRAAFRYSRGQEDEADKLGVLYAALAGFDPEAGARMWTRAAADSGGARPLRAVLFDDHPADAARAENTAKYARLVRPYFVRGQQNPRAREIIADNALFPRREATQGVVALLEAGAQYYTETARAKAEADRRRGAAAQREAAYAADRGYVMGVMAARRGDVAGAAQAFAVTRRTTLPHTTSLASLRATASATRHWCCSSSPCRVVSRTPTTRLRTPIWRRSEGRRSSGPCSRRCPSRGRHDADPGRSKWHTGTP